MPLQNRVTPGGELISAAARGTFLGNRGVLHDADKKIIRTSRSSTWLICLLEFKNRHREVMTPGRYTELFFLDEAVALAAGHRPCAECRRQHYRTFLSTAAGSREPFAGAQDLDKNLSAARRAPRVVSAVEELPDGVFVGVGDQSWLIWKGALHRWSPHGYLDTLSIAGNTVKQAVVLTPGLSVTALRHGYPVSVHPSAGLTS